MRDSDVLLSFRTHSAVTTDIRNNKLSLSLHQQHFTVHYISSEQ